MRISEYKLRILIREAIRAVDFGSFGYTREPESLADLSEPKSGEEYSITSVKFASISQPMVAKKAEELHGLIGGAGFDESTDEGKKIIVNSVHAPTYEAIRNKPFPEDIKKDYIDNLHKRSKAWSSWFLNAPYVLTNSPAFEQIKSNGLGYSHSGCCYPNAMAARNRNSVMNNPQAYVGRTLLMVFSDKEVETIPSLALTPGDASVVGQGQPKPWDAIRTEFDVKSGKSHMNIYVGGNRFIGGNLGSPSTTAIRYDMGKAKGFMKLVKIVGVADEKNTEKFAKA